MCCRMFRAMVIFRGEEECSVLKKSISTWLVVVLLIIPLAGCVRKTIDTAPNVPHPPGEVGVPWPEPGSEPESQGGYGGGGKFYRPDNTFVITTELAIEVFDDIMETRGYPKTSMLIVEDRETKAPNGDIYNIKTIAIGDGAHMYLSETLDGGVLFGFMCYGEIDKMSYDSFERFDFYMLAILSLLGEDLEKFTGELSVSPTEDNVTFAESEYADFSYMITDGVITFSANPV